MLTIAAREVSTFNGTGGRRNGAERQVIFNGRIETAGNASVCGGRVPRPVG